MSINLAKRETFEAQNGNQLLDRLRKTSARYSWVCRQKLSAFKLNQSHPSLQFKKVGKVWSARVGSHYRAIATPIEDGFLWIGTHAEYDKLLA